MEDAETKVDMPVDLLPTPRIDDEVVGEKEAEEVEEEGFFDEQLKMINSTELEARELTSEGNGDSGGGAIMGATIRDLEKKGDGKNKSFKFTVDLDFGGNPGQSTSSAKRRQSGSYAKALGKDG